MSIEKMAQQDFERAKWKAFWRKITAWLTGQSNQLLPFDEVKAKLPIQGQHYLGSRQVPMDKIIGSLGRYRDFDRAFLPLQSRTRDRWINIDKAHYDQINLPAVELIKMGEIYFVKDGNHRVSVAREHGQEFVDATVIEIEIPIPLSPDTSLYDLAIKQDYAQFMAQTQLNRLRPGVSLETKISGQYARLLEHIEVHRWYLGERMQGVVTYEQAVISWIDTLYTPLVNLLRENDILKDFPWASEVDLYLWVMDYRWFLSQAYKSDKYSKQKPKVEAARKFMEQPGQQPLKMLVQVLNRSNWLDELILQQERSSFYERTRLLELRPQALLQLNQPGRYDILFEHISVHRWYLGEKAGQEVDIGRAAASWYDQVYLPLARIIREQGILQAFPGRTETDLYLWIIEHQAYLQQEYGNPVPLEQAAEQFSENFSEGTGNQHEE